MRLIVDRYLMREVALTFLGVSLILLLIFFSATFIRQLSETVEGDYPANILFSLFALKAVGNTVFILPFAFFIAVLLTFGRLYGDNELVVLHACGFGPRRLIYSVGMLALVVALIVGGLTLFFAPWAEEKSKQMLDEAGASQEIAGIIPGRFNSFGKNSPTVYAGSFDKERKLLRDLFLQGRDENGHYVLTASYAQESYLGGERYLVLVDGHRYEGVQGQQDYRVIQFTSHGIRLREREVVSSKRARYAIPTGRLWGSDKVEEKAELHWRFAVPISTFLLALLAVPLSRTGPRRSRYIGLSLGILAYVVYNNLLTVARSMLARGEVPEVIGLWWVHGLLIVVILSLLAWQNRVPKARTAVGTTS